ncbi:ComF family protein [Paenibacillus sp. L3-i20]|uniref:ComF family protein n=1 Tax=Paenibacillus sp. L3-i20 TaxID=2905833 RepID=UPI001EE03175|nr:ComF family protein [Paenibacillus sp. L3-i20]GKU76829.1 phosphoribosyltransferase [Paenibacillus sp. L3-i20]
MNIIKDWMNCLRLIASRSVDLMAPQSDNCAVCNKGIFAAKSRSGNATGETNRLHASLCNECYGAIPWLRRIVCSQCGRGIHCEDCMRRTERPFICNRSAVTYNAAMREWLALYKYRGNERLSPILGAMLLPALERLTNEVLARSNNETAHRKSFAERGSPKISRIAMPSRKNTCWDAITYVPISSERAEERGFNQAEQLAEYVSDALQIPLYELLVRERHTEKMSFKTRSERLRDARLLFSLHRGHMEELIQESERLRENAVQSSNLHLPKDRALRILLVDDIYTTGSTVEACSKLIQQYFARRIEVYVLTWARS